MMDHGKRGYRGGGGGGRNYRGRSRGSVNRYVVRQNPGESQAGHASPLTSHEISAGGNSRNSEIPSMDDATEKMDKFMTSDFMHRAVSASRGVGNALPSVKNYNSASLNVSRGEEKEPKCLDSQLVKGPSYNNHDSRSESNSKNRLRIQSGDAEHATLLKTTCSKTDDEFPSKAAQSTTGDSRSFCRESETENCDNQQMGFSFDICLPRNSSVVKLKAPLFVTNRAKRNEMKLRTEGDNIKVLRSGMILLKGYLSLMDQVKFTKSCQALGRGPGGFYQPGYRDGAKLHLRMMCLGKNWDPETSSYGEERPVDGAKPPPIPDEFQRFVKDAIQEGHSYLESRYKEKNPNHIVPPMSPNICIINFYAQTGKLGLHQDKDESKESLSQGLPVISLSIGDTAEFLYGDQRDTENADKVLLESGDVLIFGGKSRHIFHGVSNIIPDTAPKSLLDQTDLRPGRLNLTFRQF